MFIHTFALEQWITKGQSVEVKLPRPGLVLDPRLNNRRVWLFRIDYHDDGITVTLTKIDDDKTNLRLLSMRVYDPAIETVPRFDTTFYRYMGQDGERVPYDTTHVEIYSPVKTIKMYALFLCDKLKWCKMHDGVEKIEIEAFQKCTSLEALFLPSSVKDIDYRAFYLCKNLRILSLPPNINVHRIGEEILYDCDTFFRTTQIQQYIVGSYGPINNDHQVHHAVMNFYRNQPPLHKVCLDTNISTQTIEACIQTSGRQAVHITDHDGMTPLHILAINPHADVSAIYACFEMNMTAVFETDSRGNTPLDYLKEYNVEGFICLLQALSLHRSSSIDEEE